MILSSLDKNRDSIIVFAGVSRRMPGVVAKNANDRGRRLNCLGVNSRMGQVLMQEICSIVPEKKQTSL